MNNRKVFPKNWAKLGRERGIEVAAFGFEKDFARMSIDSGTSQEGAWRVGHQGRDLMYYEEYRNGAWQRLMIDGEMQMGVAHHMIFFASPDTWQRYPEWARDRREEIIDRIKREFREPNYEYSGA